MKNLVLQDINIFQSEAFIKGTVAVEEGCISAFTASVSSDSGNVFKFDNAFVFPGFADVHVHLREPGFSYKETIEAGTAAAAAGGYTAVCSMPNLDPVPDCREHLQKQLDMIRRGAKVRVLPYGAITVGEKGEKLADMDAMAADVVAFSDDGKGVQSTEMMRAAMIKAKSLNKLIVAHCEDESYLPSPESEWRQLERDLQLVRETGCGYHMCHMSTRQSLELIRKAKAEGLDVTCETAPHYLLLDNSMIEDDGRFKMNPPIGTAEDREALLQGLKDGVIDMIATDHAPHSAEEKSRGFAGSLNGITGLEAAFPALYTGLVESGIITLTKLIELMSINPRKRFGIPGEFAVHKPADFTVFDLSEEYYVNSNTFLSKGKSTPFDGMAVRGKCLMTVCDGRIVWMSEDIKK